MAPNGSSPAIPSVFSEAPKIIGISVGDIDALWIGGNVANRMKTKNNASISGFEPVKSVIKLLRVSHIITPLMPATNNKIPPMTAIHFAKSFLGGMFDTSKSSRENQPIVFQDSACCGFAGKAIFYRKVGYWISDLLQYPISQFVKLHGFLCHARDLNYSSSSNSDSSSVTIASSLCKPDSVI